jgi:hypothetical protein
MPAQAEALNDLSSRPPWSVTIQATYFGADVVPLPVGVLGALLQAAKASPPIATTAAILIPRTGRKTFSFPINRRNNCGDATSGAYADG